ncbi:MULTISPECIES: DUF4124 domain-containing protein [Stenotrophomonas]|uniref:DUF4124 domain-containing protein n=1 Tax=Stenotrophomonas maltophilia TaxID=40324 RepID=A0A2J0SMN1_STEMA|nr:MULTISPECIES: DUF4124 domain-containing protein [Stenotrophomonas]MBA0311743.1 DUF4124 domain-containing protein [Stenotrophomonas maltophilia]MBH1408785.1 DUF4124 domain-containing protein [Stenotrophomonas maltophilia]MBH1747774.1 DUF4124 domain-containing protein [Stenotrophomonas maltophilia]MBH1867418.1 DUF4124 domain-containing protein [Stenotrophomonas maltophilia]MDH1390317.1 DUF4124 domain-containing protein [Stenotrophomonas sp. GD03701]
MSRVRCSPLLCLLLATAVHAQTNVYKCVDGPHPVYQQTPCQGRAEWRWEVPEEQSLSRGPVTKAARAGSAVLAPPRTVRSGRAHAVLIPISTDPRACERARQHRGNVLARNKQLHFLQRRQLDDAVYDACR